VDRFKAWLVVKVMGFVGFPYVDMYAPDDEVVAITFSSSEAYVDAVSEVELP
jgi:hypothetical protein